MELIKNVNLDNEMFLYKFYEEFLFDKIEDYMNYYKDDFYEFEDFNAEDDYYFDRCYYEFMFRVMECLYGACRVDYENCVHVNMDEMILQLEAAIEHTKPGQDCSEHRIFPKDTYKYRVHASINKQLCHLHERLEMYMYL